METGVRSTRASWFPSAHSCPEMIRAGEAIINISSGAGRLAACIGCCRRQGRRVDMTFDIALR